MRHGLTASRDADVGQSAEMSTLAAVWIQPDNQPGTAYPVGAVLPPRLPIVLAAHVNGLVRGTHVRFSVERSSGQVVFGPVVIKTVAGLLSTEEFAFLGAQTPPDDGAYVLRAVELVPFFPDSEKTTTFQVLANAVPPIVGKPPAAKPGIGQYLPLIIAGVALVVVIALSPTINRGLGRFLGDK